MAYTRILYISLFACENSHYLCTGTRARPEQLEFYGNWAGSGDAESELSCV